MSEIVETAITWEHDTGDIVISTRSRAVAGKLRRLGLSPVEDTDDYLTFRTSEAVLRLTLTRRASGVRKPPSRGKK